MQHFEDWEIEWPLDKYAKEDIARRRYKNPMTMISVKETVNIAMEVAQSMHIVAGATVLNNVCLKMVK